MISEPDIATPPRSTHGPATPTGAVPSVARALQVLVTMAVTGAASFVIIVLLDLCAGPLPVSWTGLLAGMGLAVGVGTLLGAAASPALLVLAACPPWLRYPAYLLPGAVISWRLMRELGVLQKWGGPHATAAAFALVACVGAGSLLFGAIVVLAKALDSEAASRLGGKARWSIALITMLVALVILWMDGALYVDTYLAAHGAMRIISLLLILAAVALVLVPWLTPRLRLRLPRALLFGLAWLVCAGLAALCAQGPGDYHLLLSRRYAGKLLHLARSALDFDRDGYASGLGGGDCAPFDAKIRPFARELPGNGVDDDCYGGDARAPSAVSGTKPPTPVAASASAPSVVLITVDTLRSDRMSVYGAASDTTPHLRAWARDALRFDRAYTSGGWTHIALTSLLRGLHLRHIEWREYVLTSKQRLFRQRDWWAGPRDADEREVEKFSVAADQRDTLHALLAARGYFTAAVLDSAGRPWRTTEVARQAGTGPAPNLDVAGFGGFERYVSSFEERDWPDDEHTTKRALEALADVPPDRPFFLWVHYMGPHYPDSEHPGTPRFAEGTYAAYDHEVAYFDGAVAKLLAAIEQKQRERSVAVLLTSDHGEEFLGLNRHHGQSVRESALRIPLLLKAPGVAAGASDALVSLVDVMPTLLAITGTQAPRVLDGVDLLAPGGAPRARTIFAETWRVYGNSFASSVDHVAAMDDSWKVSLDVLGLDEHAHPLGDEHAEETTNDWPAPALALRRRLWDYLTNAGPVKRD